VTFDYSPLRYPTSCCSVAEIISALFFNPMHVNKAKPKDPGNDRIILSNSNALPMIYAGEVSFDMIESVITELNDMHAANGNGKVHILYLCL
jgi:transketolase